jgi:hypothetical protein
MFDDEHAVSTTIDGPLSFIANEIRPLKNARSVPIPPSQIVKSRSTSKKKKK